MEIISKNFWTVISTLFGTFSGAYLAFFFERRHSEKKERDANISAAKLTQFAIAEQLNVVVNMKRNVLDPQREDVDRHLTLVPFQILSSYPSLQINSLVFMLEGEGAQLLNEIIIAEHQFNTLLAAVEQRNQRHELMQRQLAANGPSALDQATVTILRDMTNSIYELCEDALSSLQKSFDNLQKYIEQKFPGIKALSFDHT